MRIVSILPTGRSGRGRQDDGLVVSIAAGTTMGWHKYTGRDGLTVGIDTFGASAPDSSPAPPTTIRAASRPIRRPARSSASAWYGRCC